MLVMLSPVGFRDTLERRIEFTDNNLRMTREKFNLCNSMCFNVSL